MTWLPPPCLLWAFLTDVCESTGLATGGANNWFSHQVCFSLAACVYKYHHIQTEQYELSWGNLTATDSRYITLTCRCWPHVASPWAESGLRAGCLRPMLLYVFCIVFFWCGIEIVIYRCLLLKWQFTRRPDGDGGVLFGLGLSACRSWSGHRGEGWRQRVRIKRTKVSNVFL